MRRDVTSTMNGRVATEINCVYNRRPKVDSKMAKPVVFVIGASGTIGFATVQTLLAKYTDEVEIRAGVRNLEKADKLKGLPDVTVVQAEMGKKQQLVETFRGVDALFINTSSSLNRIEITISTAEAAKEAGVKFILVVSVANPNTDTILGRQFVEIEGGISKVGVPHAFLRLPYFVENLFGSKDSIVNQSSFYSPAEPTKLFACVAAADAGRAGATILVNCNNHTNKAYNIVSYCCTHNDIAAEFTKALGKEIKYVRISYEAAKQAFIEIGLPELQADGAMEYYKIINSGHPVGTTQVDRDQFEQITGEKPTDLKSWVSQFADVFKA